MIAVVQFDWRLSSMVCHIGAVDLGNHQWRLFLHSKSRRIVDDDRFALHRDLLRIP